MEKRIAQMQAMIHGRPNVAPAAALQATPVKVERIVEIEEPKVKRTRGPNKPKVAPVAETLEGKKMIKKILLSLVATLMLTGQAWAGACQTALMPAFTEAQANSLCTNLAALNTSLIPKANATYNLGSAALAWRDILLPET